MQNMIFLIILSSLWCLALQISTSEGMVFYKLRQYAESKENKIWEAIVLCPWCCASIHSIFAYLGAWWLGFLHCKLVLMYPFVVAGSSLITGLIWQLHKLIEVKSRYYGHLEQNAYFDLKQRKVNYNNNKK